METVLVINSNRTARLSARDLLKAALPQLEVLTSENAKDAITLAHHKRPLLILLAADMAGVTSTQIVQALRALPATRNIPVVAVAPEALGAGRIADSLRESCDDCLPAANVSALMLATVQRYLSKVGGSGALGVARC